EQGFLVLDGALATELERKGANLNDPLWSARCLVESPELIAEVHRDYLQAGADIIASATYQASEKGFMERGLNRREARKLMQGGIRLAVQERDSYWSPEFAGSSRIQKLKPLVAASMGPFGACLHDGSEYHGNYAASWREVSDFHRERMLWLAEAGADLLAFETIPSQAEAEILLELLEKHATDLHGQQAWISFSCKDESHVSHGERLRDCMALMAGSAQLAAAGINCTAPGLITALLQSLDRNDVPLMVYPNSGETWQAEEHCWRGAGSTDFAIADWFAAGVRLFGGCCRTRPADTSTMRKTLLQLMS
ncbi:MAG TPA: homocysteine S-methyltransferase, partial [Xanthomonadales bacterium]|nr:homocysteine S-methyltransferase [Xanthomonadales bacterium]